MELLIGVQNGFAGQVQWIPLTLVLGYLTSAGKISPWVAVAVALGDGAAKYLLPEKYFEVYGLETRGPFSKMFKVPGTMSPFGKMFVRLQGSCLIAAGVYVLMLGRPDSQGQLEAFGYRAMRRNGSKKPDRSTALCSLNAAAYRFRYEMFLSSQPLSIYDCN